MNIKQINQAFEDYNAKQEALRVQFVGQLEKLGQQNEGRINRLDVKIDQLEEKQSELKAVNDRLREVIDNIEGDK